MGFMRWLRITEIPVLIDVLQLKDKLDELEKNKKAALKRLEDKSLNAKP
jgi:hypothetical protein